jgi:hypothetical protein
MMYLSESLPYCKSTTRESGHRRSCAVFPSQPRTLCTVHSSSGRASASKVYSRLFAKNFHLTEGSRHLTNQNTEIPHFTESGGNSWQIIASTLLHVDDFPSHSDTPLTRTVNDDWWRRGAEATYNVDLLFSTLTVRVGGQGNRLHAFM